MDHGVHTTNSKHGTFLSYLFGFIASLVLTLAAYFVVADHLLPDKALVVTIVSFGIMQAFIQLFFFLHLGEESRPRWNLMVFLFMALVILIIVFGSLWIMKNLAYNVMPTMDSNKAPYHEVP